MDILEGEECASDYHSSRGCEMYASLAVIICHGVQAVRPDDRSIQILSSYLSVHIPNHDLDVPTRTAIILLLKLLVKRLFFVVGSSFVWAVHIYNAIIEETALNPQLAHTFADRLPLNHAILHLSQHYETGAQFIVCAATLV